MMVLPKLAGLSAALVLSAAWFFSGCSSSQPRDINYGTDVVLFFVPPDADSTTSSDAAVDAATPADSSNTADSDNAADSEAVVDVSIDGDN